MVLQELVLITKTVDQRDNNGFGSYARGCTNDGIFKLSSLRKEYYRIHNSDFVCGICRLKAVQVVRLIRINTESHAISGNLVHVCLVYINKRHICSAPAEI